jgi:hypothetical protein
VFWFADQMAISNWIHQDISNVIEKLVQVRVAAYLADLSPVCLLIDVKSFQNTPCTPRKFRFPCELGGFEVSKVFDAAR